MSETDTNIKRTDDEVARSRRALLTKGGIAAAAVAVVGVGAASSAAAADGSIFYVGVNNVGTATTSLSGGSTLRVTATGGSIGGGDAAIYGIQNGTQAYAVRGQTADSGGVAVYGQHDSSTTSGTGVIGQSGRGTGVIGNGTSYDLLATGSGRVGLGAIGQAGAPTSPGTTGMIARDAGGNLWYCVTTNKWQRLAGPGAAGAFHAINPTRAYDSRIGTYSSSGPMAPNSTRVVSVADGHDAAGAITVAGIVPAGATAVAFNVTITGTTAPNYLAVSPGDAASFSASTINWSGPDQSLANGSIVKLDASRQVKFFCGDQPGSTHVIFDVTGYFI